MSKSSIEVEALEADPTEILTVAQAAKYLKVSKQALYEAVAANQVPHRRLGQRIIFSRHALIAWAHGPN